MIDTSFNMYSDANGGDPDSTSPTLRRYHKLLWSKALPNGEVFTLQEKVKRSYLLHSSDLGDFYLGSDAITHSYKHQSRKSWLTTQIPKEVDELFNIGSTIGGYIIFPNWQIDRKYTINQARGVLKLIDDRFDLTLECIRRHYLGLPSPLSSTIDRYTSFFGLFADFKGYVDFFLLQDLIDVHGNVKFYLPFDDFKTAPDFSTVEDYQFYKERVISFVQGRNNRIETYAKTII